MNHAALRDDIRRYLERRAEERQQHEAYLLLKRVDNALFEIESTKGTPAHNSFPFHFRYSVRYEPMYTSPVLELEWTDTAGSTHRHIAALLPDDRVRREAVYGMQLVAFIRDWAEHVKLLDKVKEA